MFMFSMLTWTRFHCNCYGSLFTWTCKTWRFRLCYTILSLLPAKMCQSHLSLPISHKVHERILTWAFFLLAPQKWYGKPVSNLNKTSTPLEGKTYFLQANLKAVELSIVEEFLWDSRYNILLHRLSKKQLGLLLKVSPWKGTIHLVSK